MRILWVSVNCLLDNSSGASLAVGIILKKLKEMGFDVEVVGSTTFDALGAIDERMEYALNNINDKSIFEILDAGVKHTLIKTKNYTPNMVLNEELNALFGVYVEKLRCFKPDIVFYYGGGIFDLLVPIEAKKFNAKTVCYIGNAKYIHNSRWADDIDLVITDTKSTAVLYKEKLNLNILPVGSMIDKSNVVASHFFRERVLFVNPSPHKGGYLVAQLVLFMRERRPDIIFDIIDSTSSWKSSLNFISEKTHQNNFLLSNVVLHKNQNDMRSIYARARILLSPSLYWESGGRVIAEAAMNGVPAMITPVGGQQEMMGAGGDVLIFPKEIYEAPYAKLLSQDLLEQWCSRIEKYFDDDDFYKYFSNKAIVNSVEIHDLNKNMINIKKAFDGLFEPLY